MSALLRRLVMSVFTLIHAVLIKALPGPLQRNHAAAMRDTFVDTLHAATAQRGVFGMVTAGLAELADVLRQSVPARKRAPRPARWDALRSDLGHALRATGHRHALSAVLALALGIGATTAMFAVVDAVLLRGLPYPESDRLVRLGAQRPGSASLSTLSPPLLGALVERTDSLDAVAAAHSSYVTMNGAGRPQRVRSAWVSGDFFDMFGARAQLGRVLGSADDDAAAEGAVLLGHALWQASFAADRAVVGQSIVIDGRPYVVAGVLDRDFVAPEGLRLGGTTQLWLPLNHLDLMAEPGLSFLDVVGRRADGVPFDRAAAEIDALGRALGEELELPARVFSTLGALPLQDETVGGIGATLWPLLGAVALLLVIACSNVANLLLTRAGERTREMSLRAALGAGSGRIARLLLLESTVLAVAGGAAGTLLAYGAVAALRAFRPAAIPRLEEIGVDIRVLGFVVLLSAATGILIGLAPAVMARRLDPAVALRSGGRAATRTAGGRRLSHALIVAQTAVALLLAVGAGLLVDSFVRLYRVDVGFDTEQTLRMQVSLGSVLDGSEQMQASRVVFFEDLRRAVTEIPAVTEAWLTTGAPFSSGGWYSSITAVGNAEGVPGGPGSQELAHRHQISANRLSGMGLRILSGREIDATDGADGVPVVVVNEALARRYWPAGGGLGKQVIIGGDSAETRRTVVGIVSNARYHELEDAGELHIYLPFVQFPAIAMDIVANFAGDPAPVASAMREAVWASRSDLAINDLRTMQELVYADLVEPGFYTWLLGSFALLALLLAGVGVYSSVSHAIAVRTREIGTRIAVGARPADAVLMVLRGALATLLLGVGLGLAGAYATSRLLAGFLYEVEATDGTAFVAAATVVVLLGAVAAYIPARRAARVDPIIALRSE